MKKLTGKTAILSAAICAAAYSPLFAETHTLQPYAYVESFGHNAVDTGYYAKKDTKFIADFEFVSAADGVIFGAYHDSNINVNGLYRNSAGNITWTINGPWWWSTWSPGNTTVPAEAGRRITATVNGTGNTASMYYHDDGTTYTSVADSGKAFTTEDSTVPTLLFQWISLTHNNTFIKLYSFEADDDCSSGVPTLFFAPTVDADGNAGFTNIVAGTFHGETNTSVSTAMAFTDGVGSANDYKYEADTFYAKFYAYASDTDMGGVKFGDDVVSGTASAWIARGGNATLTAVPAAGSVFAGWTGDKWAITGGSAGDATITVANDRAAQLLANFTSDPVLKLGAGASAVWGEADWQVGGESASAPTSGDAVVVLSGDATVSLDSDVALGSIRIFGNGTLTIARGSHSYSAASIVADSEARQLVTLSDGKIVFEYNNSGAIQELYMNPDPGETLTLDDGKLNFAAGAKIIPGQGGDTGGNSVIIGGFTAAGALEFDGVTNMTWTGSSLLGATPETLFTNTRLDDIVPVFTYGRTGNSTTVSYSDSYLYRAYNIERDGDTMRFEFQLYDGTHTKGFYMEFKQVGNDITGRKLTSGYFKNQNKLGTRMFKYENGTASLLSGVTSASYYQAKRIVIGPRSGSRSKLTFALAGAQTLPAVSGKGVELTFDANGRGEPEEEFRSGILANNANWQTLTTEHELKDLEIRSGRLYGSYLSGTYPEGVDAIAFGWTNNNEYAGCQMQQLEGNLIRTVDLEFHQNGDKVEVRWVRSVYTRTSASSFYGKKYLTTANSGVTSVGSTQIRAYWVSTKQPVVTVNASGANTMTDSAYVVKGDEAHPIEFNAANANALPDKTTDCYGNTDLNLTAGGAYNNGIRGDKITMHPGSTLYSKASWTFHNTAQTVVIDGTTLNLDNNSKYINDLVLTNGSVVTRGNATRAGYGKNPTWRVVGEGVSTCDSSVSIVAGSKGENGTKRTYTIDVADTVAGEASDFIMSGDIANDSGYPNGVFAKSGPGTMEMQGTIQAYNNAVRVTAGTLLLGKTGAASPNVPFSLEGGTLACAAGTTNAVAAVNVTANSMLSVGAGATLTMANLTVTDGKTLEIECADGAYAKSVKVNTALDAATRAKIRLNGRRPRQASDGCLIIGGFTMIVK